MIKNLTYKQRINSLSKTRLENATKYRDLHYGEENPINPNIGILDMDERGFVPISPDFEFKIEPNHPSGRFFGPKACSENLRRLLETHPIYIDPMGSLAGGYILTLWELDNPDARLVWNHDVFDYSHLYKNQKKYGLTDGIGVIQHFYQDINIGFKLGWQGILNKIQYYRMNNDKTKKEFYDALEDVVLGIQNLICRHAYVAREMSNKEDRPELKESLLQMAKVNEKLVTEPPKTFYEAVQWFCWYIIVSKTYNMSGAAGAIDRFLKPYYDKDKREGILNDEEVKFHLACLLVKEMQYYQIGGTDMNGYDITNPISFLLIEAARELKITTNICIRVHEKQDPKLLRKAVEYMFKDRIAYFNFLGDKNMNEGFVKNGYSIELARQREKTGCHWCAIPGREYTMNDIPKINFAKVFDVALREMISDSKMNPSIDELWKQFKKHLEKAVQVLAEGIDIHLENMHEVFPELVLDLLCHGTIEKGLDATHGGVEFYNMCVDGVALATVADSFAAIEQRIEREKKLNWKELIYYLDTDFKDTEDIRLMLKNIPRYGSGGSKADEYAIKISKIFTKIVKEKPTPNGFNMIPGLFSWAHSIAFGAETGATPNGRHAGQPVSHGANPDPGFKGYEAITALATAVASVQCGYGNTVPLQIDIDPLIGNDEEKAEKFVSFIQGYFDIRGTLLNVNILDKKKILEAYKDPSKFPELIVRVTGFSAYFASLSKEWQKLIVDRIIEGS